MCPSNFRALFSQTLGTPSGPVPPLPLLLSVLPPNQPARSLSHKKFTFSDFKLNATNHIRILQATLDESFYELAGELVRFLLRSGREYDPPASDSEKLSPRFLGYFSVPSSFRRQSVEPKSPSYKEQNAHIASVKNILESHASFLMSGKELSKLVAFVKGTQFDLVEYLQRERYGSARLDDFASGLELIGQKLQMAILQSRLDAEFLLAHMCSVKFKEWIVVLATLLRRSEILFDLFQHDMRLWKAYSTTIQSHSAFTEYHKLLEDLEEKLSSTKEIQEK